MIRLTDNLWIGDSSDEQSADLFAANIGAVLNVAHDLQGTRGCQDGLDYMQVGLVDGPGNPITAYYAAVLALHAILERCKPGTSMLNGLGAMVCCHTGSRSLVVALMYMNAVSGRGWDSCLTILRERVDVALPMPHEAHKLAFNRMNWDLLASVLVDR